MQNNESNRQSGKLARLWKEKGYYIILSLCILAVGVSGYVFLSGALQDQEAVQEVLSVPVTVEEPVEQTTSPSKPSKTDEPIRQTADTELEETEPASAEAVLEEEPVDVPVTVMPVSGSVVQNHAMDRLVYNVTTQDWRVHNGVDLAAAEGQSVKAAKNGRVTAVYEDEYYGTTVVIQHDGGYTSHYSNLAAETVIAAGEMVLAGDVIGTIGSTALIEIASEPHLHFEVYCDGEPVDPAGFLY